MVSEGQPLNWQYGEGQMQDREGLARELFKSNGEVVREMGQTKKPNSEDHVVTSPLKKKNNR